MVKPIPPSANIMVAFDRYIKDPELRGLPVVEGDRVMGILRRDRFLENQILGKHGYGIALNTYRNISHLMEQPSLMVEAKYHYGRCGTEDSIKKIRIHL